MNRISPKWMALCTAAIGLTYAAGYVVTDTGAASRASTGQVTQTPAQSNQPDHGYVDDQGGTRSSDDSKSQADQTTGANQAQQGYKDGSYTGEGVNRIGSVSVEVRIESGKIAEVRIVDCTTSYPESLIEQLPEQVVALQSPDVDNVTGATESTDNFRTAVLEALNKAMA